MNVQILKKRKKKKSMISINIDKTIYIIYYAHSTVNPIWCIRNGLSAELIDNLKIFPAR